MMAWTSPWQYAVFQSHHSPTYRPVPYRQVPYYTLYSTYSQGLLAEEENNSQSQYSLVVWQYPVGPQPVLRYSRVQTNKSFGIVWFHHHDNVNLQIKNQKMSEPESSGNMQETSKDVEEDSSCPICLCPFENKSYLERCFRILAIDKFITSVLQQLIT